MKEKVSQTLGSLNGPKTLIFNINGEREPEEIIRIEEGKFFFKGEEVVDKYQVYERFNDWLKLAENIK